MKPGVRSALVAIAVFTASSPVLAIEPVDSLSQHPATLAIQSKPESALVTIDGRFVGATPISIDSVSAGRHVLTLQHNAESWLTEPVSDTVEVHAGETRIFRYDLQSRYVITSSPFGAEVLLGDSVIGTTPLITTSEILQRPVGIRMRGYEPATIQGASGSTISVPLQRLWQNHDTGDAVFKESSMRASKPVGLYISGAVTVLGGVAAAYFKVKADDRYQQYLQTGNSTLLSQTHQLDTAAGIAIVATQVGLGLFTYFILSQ